MFAVIQLGGKQYIVKENDVITTQLPAGVSGKFEIKEVLLVADERAIKLGKPFVAGASAYVSILEQKHGRKLRVMKYKSKTRYRKTIGFRPIITKVKIEKITA